MITTLLYQAIELHQKNQFDKARVIYQKILSLEPNHFDAIQLLATTYAQEKKSDEALVYYQKAFQLEARNPFLLSNLANVHKDLGNYEQALIHYDLAIKIKPDFAQAYHNRANTLKKLERHTEAAENYEQALLHNPNYAEAHNHYGILLQALFRYEEALEHYQEAIKINANYAEAFYNQGILLRLMGRLPEAVNSYIKAVEKKVNYIDAYVGLGNALVDLNKIEEALKAFDQALKINPNYPFLLGLRQYYRMKICDWREYDETIAALKLGIEKGLPVCLPFPSHSLIDSPELQKKCAEIYARHTFPEAFSHPVKLQPYKGHEKIRLAYFSSDFGDHPITHLLTRLFELHDRSQFEVIGFSLMRRPPDQWQVRVSKAFDQFLDVSQKTDDEIVKMARDLEIDIAIDLNGYTKHSRTHIFTKRVAPIQMSYLGFLGTMGAPFYDYLITDSTIVPHNLEIHYSEKLLQLPFYQCNDDQLLVEDLGLTRKDMGLPEDQFVFYSFNKPYKITPNIFSVWMSILRRVPNSVLWIYVGNDLAEFNLIRIAEKEGVDPQRLIFAQRLPLKEHLARLKLADLFLDTYPYNAGATASNVLRNGLPMITLMGETFASRYGASILCQSNLSKFIMTCFDDYINLAVRVGKKSKYLEDIKKDFASRLLLSRIFNTVSFMTDYENTLFKISIKKNK
jgi:predicted O-linked N-acetylglucosamine transferase (SPINDLY family)